MRWLSSLQTALVSAVALLACAPFPAFALENLEARWNSGDGRKDVQFEYRNGTYVARTLDGDASCGLSVCDVVFRGVLDKDGILVGERRTCAGKGCARPVWRFTMGVLDAGNNVLELLGGPLELSECGSPGRKGAPPSLRRKNFDRLDCEKRGRIQKVMEQIRDGMTDEERKAVAAAIQGLKDRYPEAMGELLLAQGRLGAAAGDQAGVDGARTDFETAVKSYGNNWGYCELAILAAAHPRKSYPGEAGRYLRRCLATTTIGCEELAASRMEVLRSQKEFWEQWKKLQCGADK